MKRTELILAILIALALLLNISLIPFGGVLTVLTISSLSCIYFGFGFALLNGIRLRHIFKKAAYANLSAGRIIGTVGAGIVFSQLLTGCLFRIMMWPGSSFTLLSGLIGVVLVITVLLIKKSKSQDPFYTKNIKRAAIVGVFGVFWFSISGNALLEYKYRNYPEYIEARKNMQKDPYNMEYRKALDEATEMLF